MKNIVRARKPLWALDWKALFIGVLGFLISAVPLTKGYEVAKKSIDDALIAHSLGSGMRDWVVTILTSTYLAAISGTIAYGIAWIRTFGYPGTYVYTFVRSDTKSQNRIAVVGYFRLSCSPAGRLVAEGKSYDWDMQHGQLLKGDKMVPWLSRIVDGSEDLERRRTKCVIIYDVVQTKKELRPYEVGLLMFEVTHDCKGVISTRTDCYKGTMQPIDEEVTHEPAYAERVKGKNLTQADAEKLLTKNAAALVKNFKQMHHSD